MSDAMISLPWKVLVPDNARHGMLKRANGGRAIGLTEKYRTSLAVASMLAAQQWARGGHVMLRDKVALTVTLHEPDKRRRDVGNYVKLIQDCLTRVAFVDDSQVDELRVVRGHVDRFTPRAEIEIRPL